MKELRILYKVIYQPDTKTWKVFRETVDPSFGYAFGTLLGDFEEVASFNNRIEAVEYVLSQTQFNQFILTDLNHIVK